MNLNKHPLDNYKRFLLNRSTTTPQLVETIENLLSVEDATVSYCFHKIMIHHWAGEQDVLFDMLSDYFSVSLLPVNVTTQGDITAFYTSSLSLIMRLIRLDFMFPHQRNMFNIDVLFNDKTAEEFFDSNITLDDVVSSVVSRRFSEKQELDLSDLCNEQEFLDKKICFYRMSLIANFKILMLRVGRDTKSLNLSYNKLTLPPLDVMNFFIKGDLIEVNLSYNSIASISDLVRVSSKIEKLWLEGNPLCEENDPSNYVKLILMKLPRLVELDGLKIRDGVSNRNFMAVDNESSRATQMIVDRFLMLYFTHYDLSPRKEHLQGFYDDYSVLSITHSFGHREMASGKYERYFTYGRNLLVKNENKSKVYNRKQQLLAVLTLLPNTIHDPYTFNVDVVKHDGNMMVIVDGLFKEANVDYEPIVLRFRRTFYLSEYVVGMHRVYHINHELFHVGKPTQEQIDNSFKHPIRNLNSLALLEPERDEIEAVIKIFCHITQLKREEAESRLRLTQWDLRQALQKLVVELTADKLSKDHFIEEDDFSDTSSLIDDEMVD